MFARDVADPRHSTIAVITLANQFASIRLLPGAQVTANGRAVSFTVLKDGDKLRCFGKWNPGTSDEFDATGIKLVGQIGYDALHDKIAAACINSIGGRVSTPVAASDDAAQATGTLQAHADKADGGTDSTTEAEQTAVNRYVTEFKSCGDRVLRAEDTFARDFDECCDNRITDAVMHRDGTLQAAYSDLSNAIASFRQVDINIDVNQVSADFYKETTDAVRKNRNLTGQACDKLQAFADDAMNKVDWISAVLNSTSAGGMELADNERTRIINEEHSGDSFLEQAIDGVKDWVATSTP